MRANARTVLTVKGEATRRRIVSAAANLISRQGAHATTLDEVKQSAEVSSSQLYHYFDGKGDLVAAVIAHHTEEVVGRCEAMFAGVTGIEGLQAWRDYVIDVQRRQHFRYGCPLGSLGNELADLDPVARYDISGSVTRWQTAISLGLRGMRDSGRLRGDADIDALSLAVLAALQGGLLLSKIQRSSTPLEASLDAVIALIGANRGDSGSDTPRASTD